MADLPSKIEAYLGRPIDHIGQEIELMDVGDGPIINKWNVVGVDRPTAAQLDAAEPAADAAQAAREALSYRRGRAAAYKNMGVEPGFENAVGDILDAVIKHIYGDTAELDAIAAKIATIKTNNPKPV